MSLATDLADQPRGEGGVARPSAPAAAHLAPALSESQLLAQLDDFLASFPGSESPSSSLSLPALSPLPTLPEPRADGKGGIASVIDHTLLSPTATRRDVDRVCDEALLHGAAAVCVNSCWVSHVAQRLRGSGVATASVVGFPLGAANTEAKVREAAVAVSQGATEIDMVQNLGLLKSGEIMGVYKDVRAVVEACSPSSCPSVPSSPRGEATTGTTTTTAAAAAAAAADVKVILETALLTRRELLVSAFSACAAGARFLKTSTGFADARSVASGPTGATTESVRLLYEVAKRFGDGRQRQGGGPEQQRRRCEGQGSLHDGQGGAATTTTTARSFAPQVKASGGVRTAADVLAMVESGAARIGASATLRIVEEHRNAGQRTADRRDGGGGGGGGGGSGGVDGGSGQASGATAGGDSGY